MKNLVTVVGVLGKIRNRYLQNRRRASCAILLDDIILNAKLCHLGSKVAHVRRYLYTCPLDYAKLATHYGLHQYNVNYTGIQDSS
jgi:hypothetical protein